MARVSIGIETATNASPMSKPASASLMDNLEFVAELEKFDPPPVANERVPSASIPHDTDSEGTWETRATYDDDAAPAPSMEESTPRAALGIGGFLLLMGLGGAAAALIFSDRIAQILR